MPLTWAEKGQFQYSGSVDSGTEIRYGMGHKIRVTKEQYALLRTHFKGKTVPIGTSRTCPPPNSLGKWLLKNVSKVAIASYVGPILIIEGYAFKEGEHDIRIIK
jgi:hypothetical protein